MPLFTSSGLGLKNLVLFTSLVCSAEHSFSKLKLTENHLDLGTIPVRHSGVRHSGGLLGLTVTLTLTQTLTLP